MNKTGKVIIPCKWEDVGSFSDGLAPVKKKRIFRDSKWGYIDKTGKEVIPCKWEFAYGFSNGLADVTDENGKSYYINKKGEIVG